MTSCRVRLGMNLVALGLRLGPGIVLGTLMGWPTGCVCASLGARSARTREASSGANVGMCMYANVGMCMCVYVCVCKWV